jgi:hypothetical protein
MEKVCNNVFIEVDKDLQTEQFPPAFQHLLAIDLFRSMLSEPTLNTRY